MRTKDFIGRWRFFDSELTLKFDGTWQLKYGVQEIPWLSALNINHGKWMYALKNLGFSKLNGGTGVRFKVFKISKKKLIIPDVDGEPIELLRILDETSQLQ